MQRHVLCLHGLHGELARSKPKHRYLTEFYLLMSAGGALGGLLVSLVAPHVFSTFLEWPIGLMCCFAIAGVVLVRAILVASSRNPKYFSVIVRCIGLVLIAAAVWFIANLCRSEFAIGERTPIFILLNGAVFFAIVIFCLLQHGIRLQSIGANVVFVGFLVWALLSMVTWGFALDPREERVRNFYGAVSVEKVWDDEQGADFIQLHHGGIVHGTQWISPDWRTTPLSYYSHDSGIGHALDSIEKNPEARVGIVGMGSATSAAYGKKGQTYRFYDINPDIVRIAKKHFTYLNDFEERGGHLEIALGDARLNLEREESQHFDVLLLDAFAGDSVPVHLLTKEAFEIYRRHMKPDGIIAVHVTNRYLALAPVIEKVAAATGYKTTRIINEMDSPYEYTDYVLVTNNEAFLKANPEDTKGNDTNLEVPLWTDVRHDLWGVLEKD